VLFDAQEFGTEAEVGSAEELDFLGIPGLLDPDQVATLLRQRQAQQQAAGRRGRSAAHPADDGGRAGHRQVAVLRKELHTLVGTWARRTSQPHATVHAELRRTCGGPDVPRASAEELQRRIDTIRRWHVGGG